MNSGTAPALATLVAGDADLRRRLAEGAAVVVAGQQPALGGGPLYTLIKALQARELARTRGVVPLFWVAGEDHDTGEAGHCDLVRRDGRIHRVSAALPGKAALRHRPARTGWDDLLAACAEHLGPGLGRDWLQAQAPTEGEDFSAWQARFLRALVPGLLTVESHQLRPRWRSELHRALTAWPVAELARTRAELLAAGATDAFGELPQAPVFADRPDGRSALTQAEALALWTSDPDVLSPGAALRPLLQQAALPCTAFIAGPGEAAYHRFIAPAYAALGVTPPQLVARISVTLIPPWLDRAARRLGRSVEELAGTGAVDDAVPPPSSHVAELAALADRLAGAAPAAARRLHGEAARLARELARADRKRQALSSAGILRAVLRPRTLRQERVLGIVPAIWEHGPGLAEALARVIAPGEAGPERFLRLEQA